MRLLSFAALLLALPRLALGQEVATQARHPETGHSYLRTSEPLTLFEAEAIARAMGGRLVTIGSAEEETFLLDNFGAEELYWMGLEYPRFHWDGGEALEFSHWLVGEPSGGSLEPFTLMNWGEPGAWGDASGDVESQHFRALIEFPKEVEIGPVPPAPSLPPNRGVLLLAIQGLTSADVKNRRNATLFELWKNSAWTFDAGADPTGDPLAGLGMILWGVGSANSRLALAHPEGAARATNQNLLERLEFALPHVTTAALLDDPSLAGTLIEGRIDLRASNASPRKGGNLAPVQDALGRETPLCVVATWTDLEAARGDPPKDSERAKQIAVIDEEMGALLATLRARPGFAGEEWWIAVAGVAPVIDKKTKSDDLRVSSAVPLLLVGSPAPTGEWLGDLSLVDLVPAALGHFGVELRLGWNLDGHAPRLAEDPPHGENLIVNGGAERQFGWSVAQTASIAGWRNLTGFRVGRHTPAKPIPFEGGLSHFQGAGKELARLEQTVDLQRLGAALDRGTARFRLGAWMASDQRSTASIGFSVEFLTEKRKALEKVTLGPLGAGGSEPKEEPPGGWLRFENEGRVPRHTRAVRLILLAEGPSALDGTMADELTFELEWK